jgi:hypothetical protein
LGVRNLKNATDEAITLFSKKDAIDGIIMSRMIVSKAFIDAFYQPTALSPHCR